MTDATMEAKRRAKKFFGIDPGTHTGIALWNKEHRRFDLVQTLQIFRALTIVVETFKTTPDIFVRVEDARLRTFIEKNTGPEKWQGAGSIKRDCTIWEEVLTAYEIPFEFVHPKHVRETTSAFFKSISGWQARTSKHSREAGYMVLNM